jgi:hypothetical protein
MATGTAESTVTLREQSSYRQGTRTVVPEGKGQKIKVRLMGWEPGSTVVEGSSADYPVDRIVRDFPESFPAGTRMRANHDSMCEAGGDVRRIMAKTTSAPWAEADGMYAEALVREGEATEFIRQFADVIGTSISTAVEVQQTPALDDEGFPKLDEDGEPVLIPLRSERGAVIVDRFLSMSESPYNSVDFVEVPGADGAIVNLALESAKEIVNHTMLREASSFAIGLAGVREKSSPAAGRGTKPAVEASAEEREGEHMDEVLKAIEALNTKFDAFVNESKAAKEGEAQAKVDAEALESARTESVSAYKAGVEAIEAAKLLKPTAEALKARAAKGEDITNAIESAKTADEAYLAAAKEHLAESHDDDDEPVIGRIREGAGQAKTAAEALPKGW